MKGPLGTEGQWAFPLPVSLGSCVVIQAMEVEGAAGQSVTGLGQSCPSAVAGTGVHIFAQHVPNTRGLCLLLDSGIRYQLKATWRGKGLLQLPS